MKRPVLIGLTFGLLLLSEAVTLVATHADEPAENRLLTPDSPQKLPSQKLKVENLEFFYKQDSAMRHLTLKSADERRPREQTISPSHITNLLRSQTLSQAEIAILERRYQAALGSKAAMAREAYEKAVVEEPLIQWRRNGGPSPEVFNVKVHLNNVGRDAVINLPIQVTLRAKLGEIRRNPSLRMTDFDQMEKTATWENISVDTVVLPALAPDIDTLFQVKEFELRPFLREHPGKWLMEMEAEVGSSLFKPVRQTLTLIPDHYMPLPGQP